MKKYSLQILLGIFVLILIFSAGCTETPKESEKKTYIVGIDRYCPPYAYIGADGNPTGFDVESIQWIAEDQGFLIEFKAITWNENIPALESGEIDLFYTCLTITPERLERVDFTIPYWKVEQGVAVREDSKITMEQFMAGDGVIIGIVNSTFAHEWLKEQMPGFDQKVLDGSVVIYNSYPMSIIGLQNGGCDAVVFDEVNVRDMIQNKPMRILGIMETGVNEELGVAVQKGDDELREILNEGLTNLMNSPKWEELSNKYIYSDRN